MEEDPGALVAALVAAGAWACHRRKSIVEVAAYWEAYPCWKAAAHLVAEGSHQALVAWAFLVVA